MSSGCRSAVARRGPGEGVGKNFSDRLTVHRVVVAVVVSESSVSVLCGTSAQTRWRTSSKTSGCTWSLRSRPLRRESSLRQATALYLRVFNGVSAGRKLGEFGALFPRELVDSLIDLSPVFGPKSEHVSGASLVGAGWFAQLENLRAVRQCCVEVFASKSRRNRL